ncbi:hypothetical protein RN001_007254 [Aquatica leii]|uniref:Multidrug resistance-associated protein lethal(2)03659 n=1 Tax=Aquatica leii TaxID=1421715 RepID=A0AAN7QI75_9COLE|nr:hypothetical protein RN001_007254 [Aquatica leii]
MVKVNEITKLLTVRNLELKEDKKKLNNNTSVILFIYDMEDHTHHQKRNPNPRESASLFSILTYLYTLPIFFYGRRNIITEDDIYETFSKHKSSDLGKKARELWALELKKAEKNQTKPSLKSVIIKLNGWKYCCITIALGTMEFLIKPLQTLLLGELILCYSSDKGDGNAYVYAIGIIISSIMTMAITHPCLMESYQITLNMRIICSSLIYDKVLKLNKSAVGKATSGQIINMLSNDIGIFDKFPFTSQLIFVAPIQALIFMYFMYKEIGISALFGILIQLLFIPVFFSLRKLIKKFRTKASVRRDERLRLMNEIIQGIKVIKMYAWEQPFAEIINKLRKFEVKAISILVGIKGLHLFYVVFTTLALYVTFVFSVLLNHNIKAKSAFIITAFFASLSVTLTFLLPSALTCLGEVSVALKRINNFLLSDEINLEDLSLDKDYAVSITKASAKWHRSSKHNTITNIDVHINWGLLTTVIGPVGSGKSTLLQIILRELPLTAGDLRVNGTFSYASQEPWIFSASIRQNILFDNEIDEERYNKVIKCCALERDLKLFPYGDKTTVSERGDSLSGGQKARINLARAIYKQAEIYLLDDPFSAVDNRVGKQIFEECVREFLKSKTVVLVTHQLQYLKYADNIIVLEGGSVQMQGTISELEKSGFDFVKYLGKNASECNEDFHTSEVISSVKMNQPKKQQEHCATGKIPMSIYKDYFFKSKNYLLIVIVVILFVLSQLATSASFYFVALWVNQEQAGNRWERKIFICMYSGITVATIIFTVLQLITFVRFAKETSESFHNSMFESIVHSSIKFFNLNSSGRILNRFSKDLGNLDEQLPHAVFVTIRSFLSVLGIFGLIIAIRLELIIPTIVIIILLRYARNFYLATSLNILRAESVVRSFLYGHINASLQGLTTIRAFGAQEALRNEFYYHQDTHSTVSDMYFATSRAFGYWMDSICVLYIIVVTLYFTFSNEKYGGNVGLALTQALQLMNLLSWCVRQMTEVENCMISTERILEYTSLEKERDYQNVQIEKPPTSWPNEGRIEFVNVSLNYSKSDPCVLRNLNFTIQPKEKIGIVGRTGAGKSSIISSLFQLYEIEGSIIIDGVDIKNISLHDLRQQMSIIPQDPVLFTGSVRKNLDPFNEFNDDLIWMALEEVRLKDVVDKMNLGLNSELSQNGLNLSVGQRQLICLARAIIRNNKILILDEATANVDLHTDEIIQETIKKKFLSCTVITVAHRLNTIINSDKIIVMEGGELIEFGHPYILLQDKNSMFYSMAQQTEDSASEFLIWTAKTNYEEKQENRNMESFSSKHKKNRNPRANANFFSAVTFFFEHKASRLGELALKLWAEELKKCKDTGQTPSLFGVFVKLFWKRYFMLMVLFAIVELGFRIYTPLSLGALIDSYSHENRNRTYIYAFSIIACSFASFSIIHPYFLMCVNAGVRIQIVCSTLIYQKILKLNKAALRQTTPGQIINLLSNDITTFETFFNLTHHIFVTPLQTCLVLYLTYREIGISAILGASLIFLFIPIHYLSGRLISKYRLKTSIRRDERIRLMNEIVQGINIIKMYAWEKPFALIITLCRKLEIDSITMTSYIKGAFSLHTVFITTSIFITIISTALFNTTINAKSAFIITSLYYTFGLSFMLFLPQGVAALEESKISIKRITKFLLSDEVETNIFSNSNDYAVSVKDGSAKWDMSSEQYTFSKLNCNISFGSLTAVIGPVGSGKSSFFHVVLQELSLLTGDVSINGSLSYASQEPWIFSSSVQNNILFGNTMDEERYKNVVKCCALDHDFKLFPYGDSTTVGERGASLSGGQKARINLARAVYKNADIYLLDDPLSAVDTHVGKQIFEECIQTFLKNKTVILITHQLQYLKYVDNIIVLDNGVITVEGSPTELETTGFDFAQYLQKDEDKEQLDTIKTKLLHDNALTNQAPKMQAEAQSTGIMPFSIYKDYILASKSYGYALFAFSCFVLTQLSISLAFYFVAYWVKMEREEHLETYDYQRTMNMYIYSAITLSTIAFTIMRTVSYVNLSMKSSKVLHNSMFDKIIHASVKFFNTNSSGRILNRFAKDLGTIDEVLPTTTIIGLRTLFTTLGNLIVVCVVDQWFIIPTIIILFIVYCMRRVYLLTNLSIIRVESITRSPVYGHANASLQGLATIRAFGVQKILTNEFYAFQDERSSAYYLSLTMSRSFAYYTDVICFAFVALLTIYFTLSKESTGEKIGLAITQALQLMGLLPWAIRHLTEVESFMVSVERIMEYNLIEQERQLKSLPKYKPLSTWPERGEIKFTNVYLKYSDTDPYVLKNLNFIIKPQQKIGIVGRTGAGKSSIITSLFQLVEPEGVITIDGIDIKNIGLHDLRKKMSIIPQDPVLFSGTVRKNLDPFDEFPDCDLWKALEEVRLKEVVCTMGPGLNATILQGGSNLSVGQRQLICLARAIIRDNKILILDEATANVDLKTDDIIQEAIRTNFVNCTVITVAHRLNTIMDSDKVLVMDGGEVIEFDHPYILLQNKGGVFYNMVWQTEDAIAKTLMDIANKNYQQTLEENGTL